MVKGISDVSASVIDPKNIGGAIATWSKEIGDLGLSSKAIGLAGGLISRYLGEIKKALEGKWEKGMKAINKTAGLANDRLRREYEACLRKCKLPPKKRMPDMGPRGRARCGTQDYMDRLFGR